MRQMIASLCLAATAAFALPAAATTVTVDLSDLAGTTSNNTVIQTSSPGFGSSGPVTLNWDPESDLTTQILFWNGDYSGDDAGFCGSGGFVACIIDMTVSSGYQIVFDSFALGGWPNVDRTIGWDVIDLTTNLSVLSGSELVSGSTPSTLLVGVTSTTGFRLLFGPDGFNGGVTELTYSYAPIAAVPLPAGGLLLVGALGGLALLRRRRSRVA